MGISATHCQGNVREFQSVWRVVTLHYVIKVKCVFELSVVSVTYFKLCGVHWLFHVIG